MTKTQACAPRTRGDGPVELPAVERTQECSPHPRGWIAARIPGTGIHLGLSRRLYPACAALHLQQTDMPDHYEQEQRYRMRVREVVSTAFRLAEEHLKDSWLTGPLLPVRVDDPEKPLLLEAATAESYLALEPTDPVLSTARRTA